MIKYDDVGSLPLPDTVDREGFERAFVNFEGWALDIYRDLLELKIDAGVQVPCYPQVRDMNGQFLKILNDSESVEEPYLVHEDNAVLPEFEALEMLDLNLPKMKICVTGPLELSVSEFEGRIYSDIMMNIARSLNRFIRKAESLKGFDIEVISIDEPSLGTNPSLEFDKSTFIEALNIVADTDRKLQIHLHSPTFYETVCRAEKVDIIDIGAAATPEYLDSIDPEILERYEKGIRVGVSRTDALSLSAEFNEKYNVNVWTDESAWNNFLEQVEPPSRIAERIEGVYNRFGNFLEYLGPDCGLGGAKKLELAKVILKNTTSGIERFLGD
ncbi:hypothetical protein AKJ40_00015 [candidate division MSBL1 archaeon SCGC-AAA259M10]|uniref:Cobalamin-independent methionine synthase MetE C-terminal/archaeal domain-containing protein n=4 Tax=candidate division MSBL1 TaxID=215777 RepID=A0A133U5T1_9EURY|nr:hypothetical protein AKJ62_02880 [candidate division MSBL1 archaeon SCGC-AAA259D14]KXA94446.1 hypothetical protein AKJ36_02875 [candidate division MSBL1 archaeon SCGC-AAA259I07]KXB00864.1 hypothetical protein AKJ40_00015 [candidate division MSBL1 archaeon SCGC-AAA259M10]